MVDSSRNRGSHGEMAEPAHIVSAKRSDLRQVDPQLASSTDVGQQPRPTPTPHRLHADGEMARGFLDGHDPSWNTLLQRTDGTVRASTCSRRPVMSSFVRPERPCPSTSELSGRFSNSRHDLSCAARLMGILSGHWCCALLPADPVEDRRRRFAWP